MRSLALTMLLVGCGPPSGDSAAPLVLPDGVSLGPETTCAAPVSDRLTALTEQRDARGLDVQLNPHPQGGVVNFNGGVVLEDLDSDGDLDLALGSDEGAPRVFENDGTGMFAEVAVPAHAFGSLYQTGPAAHAAADIDGDGVLDLVQVGAGWVWWSRGTGALGFAEPAVLWEQTDGRTHIGTLAMGDMDGDGDLDMILPGLEDLAAGGEGGPPSGSADILLRNDGAGVFTAVAALMPGGEAQPGVAITAAFTDREGDGDMDLMILPDLGQVLGDVPPGAFWRNDGGEGAHPYADDDAGSLGFELRMSAMGLTNGDWNGDGRLDYCVSDVGPTRCLVSQPAGDWVDAGRAMGTGSEAADDPGGWSHWSVDVEDLDGDGWPELVAAGGAPTGGISSLGSHPDALLRGSRGAEGLPGFSDMSGEIGFASRADHYGGAVGDIDGDGFPEIVMAAAPDEVRLWSAGCTGAAWVEVRLEGPPGNPTGVGAHIRVEAGGRSWTREVMHLRAMGQGPGRFTVGLGDREGADGITVRWPDGETVEVPAVPGRRVVTVRHPDAGG